MTRDNPGGDAENPTDAALTRLLKEPIGFKTDKFRTLRAHFADAKNWKRVRFFGHPTRAGFRYGKSPAYAIALLAYAPTEGDEPPHRCLERFVKRGRGIAKSFDIEMEPLTREVAEHYRGPESVDWAKREEEESKRRAERKAELERRRQETAKRRQARAEARKKARERATRRRMMVHLRRAANQAGPPKTTAPTMPGSQTAGKAKASATRRPPRPPAFVQRMKRAMRRAHHRAHMAAHTRAAKSDALADGAAPLEVDVFVRGDDKRPPRVVVDPPLPPAQRPKPPAVPKKPPPKPPTEEEKWKRAWEIQKKRYGMAAMPVIRTAGEFQTLFDADRYLGAVVAYHSWPGTCLVQGFAVKVGSDEKLAERVLERWIREMAPRLMWEDRLRETPEFKNR